jgi:hypothetical protein
MRLPDMTALDVNQLGFYDPAHLGRTSLRFNLDHSVDLLLDADDRSGMQV